MYQIWGQNNSESPFLLWSSNTDDVNEEILDPQVTSEIGKSGSFSFSITQNHYCYDRIIKMVTRIRVDYDEEIIFYGRVLNTTADEYNQLQIDCEGALSFLNDSIIEPSEQEETIEAHFSRIVDAHNLSVDSWKRFKVGVVTISNKTETVKFGSSSFGAALSAIEEQLTNPYGGFLETRLESDGLYLDWIGDYDTISNQSIEFGENLITLSNAINGEELCTVLYPFGKDNLDISSVNDGVKYLKTPLFDTYGWIAKTVQFDNIVTADALIIRAQEYIDKKLCKLPQEISITAVDLHLIDPFIDMIKVGDSVSIISVPNGIQKAYTCISIDYDIFNPENNSYKFGDPNADRDESLSQNYSSYVQATNRTITNNYSNTLKYYKELDNKVNIAANDISIVANDVTEIKGKTTILESDNLQIHSELSTLNSQQANTTANIINLIGQADAIDPNTGLIKQEVLNKKIGIIQVKEDIVSVAGRVLNIETEVTNINGQQANTTANIINLIGQADAIDPNTGLIKQEVLNKGIAAIQLRDDITTISGKVLNVETTTTNLNSEVTNIKNAVAEKATIEDLEAAVADIKNLTTGTTVANYLRATNMSCTNFMVGGIMLDLATIHAGEKYIYVLSSTDSITIAAPDLPHSHKITVADDGTVTLGEVVTDAQNFSIADTKFYKDGVSAVGISGVASLTASYNSEHNYYNVTVMGTLTNGNTFTIKDRGFTPTEAYDAGYNAGVWAVKNGTKVSISMSGGVSSSTQVTVTATATAKYNGETLATNSKTQSFEF